MAKLNYNYCPMCGTGLEEHRIVLTVNPGIHATRYVCPDCGWSLKINYNYLYEPQSVPESCRYCSNHPSNGGSGICHCTLGLSQIRC